MSVDTSGGRERGADDDREARTAAEAAENVRRPCYLHHVDVTTNQAMLDRGINPYVELDEGEHVTYKARLRCGRPCA